MKFPSIPVITIEMSHNNPEVKSVPSLSDFKDTVVNFVSIQLSRFEKKVERTVLNPINNYLKTPEEIENDLSHQVNFHRVIMSVEVTNSYAKLIEHKDGYINIHDPNSLNQGFMEENY